MNGRDDKKNRSTCKDDLFIGSYAYHHTIIPEATHVQSTSH